MIVTVNDERYLAEKDVVAALALGYNAGIQHSVVIANLCDGMLDPSGRLLGLVRVEAMKQRDNAPT